MGSSFNRLVKAAYPSRLGRHPLSPVLLAALVFAVIGLGMPPRTTDSSVGPGLDGNRSVAPIVAPEDLATFLTMSRWGTDVQSVEDAEDPTADSASTGLNPELVKLGFIGLTLTARENTVLLTHPNGDAIRLTGGDALPDDRTLVSVTDNALTLEDVDGRRETLVLFPRVSATAADEPHRNLKEPIRRLGGQTPDGPEKQKVEP